jgi:two-component system, chemotaxis family, protein-glutamate methylesterase/glutaminase
MIRVLIVEDSPVEQQLLAHILDSDPLITVVGVAVDGEMALAEVARLKPDVVTMDIYMPKLDGFDTTRRIMESTPLPIIIITGNYNSNDSDKLFRAMEAGGTRYRTKAGGIGAP